MENMTFVVNMAKVKELTYQKFWSLTELAQQAHISLATIFALQAKKRQASKRTVAKIAAALDVSPADIIEK